MQSICCSSKSNIVNDKTISITEEIKDTFFKVNPAREINFFFPYQEHELEN